MKFETQIRVCRLYKFYVLLYSNDMKLYFTLLFFLSFHASSSILPPNQLHLEETESLKNDPDKNQSEFLKRNEEIDQNFAPIVKRLGGTLFMRPDWDSTKVNASASYKGVNREFWVINSHGGYFRREEITPDGFTMALCHELGHHIAGFPFYNTDYFILSSEGQADYFASQACARKLWFQKHRENLKYKALVEPAAYRLCNHAWSTIQERHLCYRIAVASRSLTLLSRSLKIRTLKRDFPEPRASTKDQAVVSKTFVEHPNPQCRYDTYLQGALCRKKFSFLQIPGKSFYSNRSDPYLVEKAQSSAFSESCPNTLNGSTLGERPRCWFKPEF